MIKRTWKHAAKGYLILVPFLLVIVWLLVASALADQPGQSGVANTGTDPDESLVCSDANAIPAKKRLYLGEYTDLGLYQKFRIKAAPIVNKEALKHAAIAYTYMPSELVKAVEEHACWKEFSDMFLEGRVAMIKQEETNWKIVSSPGIIGMVAQAHKVLREAGYENWYGIHLYNEPQYMAWVDSWNKFDEGLVIEAAKGSLNLEDHIGMVTKNADYSSIIAKVFEAIYAEYGSGKVLAMGVENKMFGAQAAGRVVTWDGDVNLPEVKGLAQAME